MIVFSSCISVDCLAYPLECLPASLSSLQTAALENQFFHFFIGSFEDIKL